MRGQNKKKQEIFFRIKPIFSKLLEVDKERITPKARLVEDLGADSLDSVDITIKLEEVFNIEIFDEDVEKMINVDDVLTYLAQHIPLSINKNSV